MTFLSAASLVPVWDRVATHLERRALVASGTVQVDLDDDGADRLGQVLHTVVRPGRVRLNVASLDAALRSGAAGQGVVGVVEAVTGRVLVDRAAARQHAAADWDLVWRDLDEALRTAGLGEVAWAGPFVADLRRSGVLTRAGLQAASAAVEHAGRVWQLVHLREGDGRTGGELAQIAATATGTAHGLDATTAAALVLRSAAAAYNLPTPTSASERRELWALMGVAVDQVSGTVIVWGARPPGTTRWAHMMGERRELGLATHLSVAELRQAGPLVRPGDRVWVTENPQVLQVMTRAGVRDVVVCTSGNPAAAGWMLLRQVLTTGAHVAYHGDFDWAGVAIAGRVITAGATPWRMGAQDYIAALERAGRQPLSGTPASTPWDEQLAVAMRHHAVAVHEESLLDVLLSDVD